MGRLLTQLWYFQGRRRQIDVESVSLDFASPRADSNRPVTDPWFEFNPTQLLSAGAYDRGSMQRMPPQSTGVISGWDEHYRERCDGRLPWESPSQAVSPTFRPGRPQSRS
jgi:hypothetical protein